MPADDLTNELTQEERIAKLRRELEALGGTTTSFESMPADMEEEFLRHVLEYERAEPTTLFALLQNAGVEIPASSELQDNDLATKLHEIIQKLASLGAYLQHTNHLSDRELYDYLYSDGLREENVFFPDNPSYTYTIDLTGSGSDEDNLIYLKYYADEAHRKQWTLDWPNDPMPEQENPPFDRDQSLPRSALN